MYKKIYKYKNMYIMTVLSSIIFRILMPQACAVFVQIKDRTVKD